MIFIDNKIGSNDTRIVPHFFCGSLLFTPDRERTQTSIEFTQYLQPYTSATIQSIKDNNKKRSKW